MREARSVYHHPPRSFKPPQQAAQPIYLLRLKSLRGDDIRRLRWLLKEILRRHQLKCISIEIAAEARRG
jgi:hypothetical protein